MLVNFVTEKLWQATSAPDNVKRFYIETVTKCNRLARLGPA